MKASDLFVKVLEHDGLEDNRIILEKCKNSKGVHLVEIPVDYSENKKILNKVLPDKCRQL